MIISFVTDSVSNSKELALAFIKAKLKQSPNAHFASFDAKEFSVIPIDELTESQALFKNKYIILLSGILSDLVSAEIFKENINSFKKSKNIFCIADSGLTKDNISFLEKYSEKMVLKVAQTNKENTGNLFGIIDLLLESDRKGLFLAYNDALGSASVEQIYSIFAWMFKTCFIVMHYDHGASGLKPFIYKKYKRFIDGIDKDRFLQDYNRFIQLPVKSRNVNIPLEILLEKWITSLKMLKK